MTNVELGLSRSKREPGFMTTEPKFTAIVAHAHGALLADVARTLQTAVLTSFRYGVNINSTQWP